MGGHDNLRLNERLQDDVAFEFIDWGPAVAVQQLQAAGLAVVEQLEAFPETRVADIGAVVYYLRAIPWQIEGFTVEAYRDKLLALHQPDPARQRPDPVQPPLLPRSPKTLTAPITQSPITQSTNLPLYLYSPSTTP